MKSKIMSAQAAVALLKDGDCIATTSAGVVGYPEYVIKNLEQRFLTEGHPAMLTLYAACGHGCHDGVSGDNRFAHPGMLKRYIGTHPDATPLIRKMIEDNAMEAYVLPQGVMNQLYRCSAAKQPGLISKIGIGTYIDPRQDGGKMNSVTTEEIVRVMELDGEEWLYFKSHPVTAAIIRGTTADENGNVTLEREALKLELLEVCLAAKAKGGTVIVQVEQVAAAGTLNSKDIVIPGELVDAVVVTDCRDNHRQTDGTDYNPYFSGEALCPPGTVALPKEVLKADDIICRRAVFELFEGAVANVGVGIGSGVGPAAGVEGIADKVTFTIELGVFGGIPQPPPDFGASKNPTSFVAQPSMFDYYHGGNLDITFLGSAEIDGEGNVNVSRFGGRAAGQGGFIDISQTSKKVVFCTYFSAKGFKASVSDAKLNIESDGQVPKFVEKVNQITFNGKLARQEGRNVMIVTERGVFRLVPEGVMLTEIAPGVDLQKDIIDRMGFKPLISPELKLMDSRIFIPGRIGCFDK